MLTKDVCLTQRDAVCLPMPTICSNHNVQLAARAMGRWYEYFTSCDFEIDSECSLCSENTHCYGRPGCQPSLLEYQSAMVNVI